MKYCFGIDIGGTTVKCGLFTVEGKLVDKWETVTDKSEQGNRILKDVAGTIADKLKEKAIDVRAVTGIGVGVPGPVLLKSVVKGCVNLGWSEYNVKEELEKELELICGTTITVSVENDANVAALGELLEGTGKGCKSLVMVTLGTGVGGGIVLDGKIVSGATGAAGEIGHMPVLYDEQELCNCGKRGCLEQIASATGIVRHAKRVLAGTERNSVLRGSAYCEEAIGASCKEAADITAKDVFDAFSAGDGLAEVIVNDVCSCLATALAHITCVMNPEIIVIGGGVSRAGQVLIDTVSKYYKEKAFNACKDTPIVLASLGNDAGIYGAAGLVL